MRRRDLDWPAADPTMGVDLNLFTNFTANRVEQLPLFETIRSFSQAFDLDTFQNVRVFCHAAPLRIRFADLYAKLREYLPERDMALYSTRTCHKADVAFYPSCQAGGAESRSLQWAALLSARVPGSSFTY